jgi:transcriptional regulator GlxA family with amidase domain
MHRIGFVAYSDFQVLSLCTVSAFECANILSAKPLYELQMLSETGGPIRTLSGLILETPRFSNDQFDILIVLGMLVDKPAFSPGLVEFVKSASKGSRRVISVCAGSLVFAEAGLLAGRQATTHWAYAQYFPDKIPKVKLDKDLIYITDDSIWTLAGGTTCIDPVLAMVEKDAGKELARAVARKLVLYHRRVTVSAAFGAPCAQTEVSPHSKCVGLCAAQSQGTTDSRAARGNRTPQSAPVKKFRQAQ